MARLDFKSDYICTYKNVLNKQQCQHLIDKFEDSPTQQTKTIVDNHMSFTEINISMHNDWKEYTGKSIHKCMRSCRHRRLRTHRKNMEMGRVGEHLLA